MSCMDTDPWDWSVEAVIAHLCQDPGPLFPKYKSIIDKTDLETSIRDNYLTGDCLLQLTDTQIEKCLGTKAIGPQIHCRNNIQQLQKQSTKWLNQVSHNLVPEQAHSIHPPNIASSDGLVSRNITQTPHDLLPHNTVIQVTSPAKPKKVIPTLLANQTSSRSSNREANATDQHESLTDNGNHTATSSSGRSFISNHDEGHGPNWRELFDRAELPQVPEHMFFRRESQAVEDRVAGSVQKGKSKIGKSQESEHPIPETAEYKMLKEIEAAQVTSWQATKLPRLELEAYQLWIDAKDKHVMQRRCLQKVEKLQHRLQRMEREILTSSSNRDLKRMAEILQPTIVDIATWQWKLKLYRQARQPEKPLTRTVKKPKKRKPLDSNDEIDLSSEDWDDFIDDDEDDYEDDYENEDEHSGDVENSTEALDKVQPIQNTQASTMDLTAQVAISTKSTKDPTSPPTVSPGILPDISTALVCINPLKKEAITGEEAMVTRFNKLPQHWDLDAWRTENPACTAYLIANKKQEHLMAWNIAHQPEAWKTVSPHISEQSNSNFAWSKLGSFLQMIRQPNSIDIQALRKSNAHDFDAMVQIAIWYTLWHCMEAIQSEGIPRSHVDSVLRSTKDHSGRASFAKFWRVLQEIKQHWDASRRMGIPARSALQSGPAIPRSQYF